MLGVRDKLLTLLPGGSLSYYDLVLAFVPVAFVVAILLGRLLSLPPHVAMAGAAAVAVLALFDALYLNPPQGSAGRPG